MNKRIAVLGCGWLGLPLAISLMNRGYTVHGSTTSKKKLGLLKNKGMAPYLISISEDTVQGDIGTFLTDVSVLVINIPPKLRGARRENYVSKMQLLNAEVKRHGIKRLLFVSSTSVYGNLQGEITENSVPKPATESGRQLLAAEKVFSPSDSLKATIVRFGGLMGDDRHPVRMLAGKTGLTNGNEYINLIHQSDCINIIEHIITKQWWNQTVNGVYPYHPKKSDYYPSEAVKRGLQPPKYQVKNAEIGKKIVPFALLDVKAFSFNTAIIS